MTERKITEAQAEELTARSPLKSTYYPFRYECHNARAFVPTGRLMTNDDQILVDGILSADFGEHLAKCVNASAGMADPEVEIAQLRAGNKELVETLEALMGTCCHRVEWERKWPNIVKKCREVTANARKKS